jgi:hypothetical protein
MLHTHIYFIYNRCYTILAITVLLNKTKTQTLFLSLATEI